MTVMRTMGLAPLLPPEASVEQSANEYVVHLAVPGFAQEELEVEIAGRFVTVRGDQTTPRSTMARSACTSGSRIVSSSRPTSTRTALPPLTRTVRWSCTCHAPNGGRKTRRTVPIERRFGMNPDASGV